MQHSLLQPLSVNPIIQLVIEPCESVPWGDHLQLLQTLMQGHLPGVVRALHCGAWPQFTIQLIQHGDCCKPLAMNASPAAQLTLLFDGGCPLCVREVRFLERRDHARRIRFVDIDAPDYNPAAHGAIGYREAMGRIHAICSDGTVLQDVAVFREAYRLIGLGWLYAPTRWPLLSSIVNRIYSVWASRRLQLTGRPDLDTLCSDRNACRVSSTPD